MLASVDEDLVVPRPKGGLQGGRLDDLGPRADDVGDTHQPASAGVLAGHGRVS
jgi:hypothetical protein